MFDTMTLTKITAGLCGSLLVFLLGGWVGEILFHTGGGHGGDDHAKAGFVIEVAEGGAGAEAEEGPSFEELLAAADVGKGEKVFGKCKACHKLEDGANGTGPHLFGVVDRDIASVSGFGYSAALEGLEGAWTPEHLDGFLESPKNYAPGTKMSFAGLKKAEDRANLIAYLETVK
ncbi:Cytochrome c-552 [Pseudoruegeria aquimaris]|uniref:Cytochrome c-552 n=1 Tax=Pseudoruegeria aquimaris TaxID=393663 RepID=A0A1Y5SFN5_9RHOB|nr:cytochrome c family protein [Pseudoruegeria aquimaris]SLN39716.1 Cytochrome c-552 [Pseudoruegeria aquimaris]